MLRLCIQRGVFPLIHIKQRIEFRKAGCLGVGFASSLMPKDKAAARDWDACAEYVHMLLTKAKGE